MMADISLWQKVLVAAEHAGKRLTALTRLPLNTLMVSSLLGCLLVFSFPVKTALQHATLQQDRSRETQMLSRSVTATLEQLATSLEALKKSPEQRWADQVELLTSAFSFVEHVGHYDAVSISDGEYKESSVRHSTSQTQVSPPQALPQPLTQPLADALQSAIADKRNLSLIHTEQAHWLLVMFAAADPHIAVFKLNLNRLIQRHLTVTQPRYHYTVIAHDASNTEGTVLYSDATSPGQSSHHRTWLSNSEPLESHSQAVTLFDQTWVFHNHADDQLPPQSNAIQHAWWALSFLLGLTLVIVIVGGRRTAEQLNRAQIFQALFEAAPVGISIKTAKDQKIRQVNPALAKLLRSSPEALDQRDEASISAPEDQAADHHHLAVLLATGQPTIYEKTYEDAQGQRRPVELRSSLLPIGGDQKYICSFVTDHTLTHQATQAHYENERRLQMIIESAHLGTWEWNIETDTLTFCARWAATLGYTLPQMSDTTLESWLSKIHENDRSTVRNTLEAHLAGRTDRFDCIMRLRHQDSRWVWVHATGQVIAWTAQGKPLTLLGTQADITERKLAERELAKLSNIASQTNNAVIITDPNGITEWVNDAYTNITGYTAEEAIGKKPGHLLQGPETDHDTITTMREAIAQAKPFHVEVLNYHKSGKAYWIDVRCNPIYNDKHELTGFIAIEMDITSSYESHLLLKRQQEMLESMSEQARIGAWEFDLKHNTVFWSTMTRAIHAVPDNFEPSLELALGFFEPGDHQNDIIAAVDAAKRHGTPWSCEAKIINALGETIWVRMTGKAEWHHAECVRLFGSYQDINTQKQFEVELESAKELAESATSAKSEFLATMSHEIRTPMNGVLGMLHLLSKSELTPNQQQKVQTAQDSAQSLLILINDILDFSKVESGKLQIESLEVDLPKYLYHFAQSMALRAQDKGLELLLDETALHHHSVYTDPGRLRQILTNLVGNAIKFTHEGTITLRAQSALRDGKTQLRLTIEDTGVGIPAEKIATLFDPFTQVDASTTREYGGTGLGLAICKKLCKLMGGELSVSSTPGAGSQFEIMIPVSASKPLAPWRLPADQSEHLLLMEPNRGAATLLSQILEKIGAKTTHYLPDLGYPKLPPLDGFTKVLLPCQPGWENVLQVLKQRVHAESRALSIIFLTQWDFDPSELNTDGLNDIHFIPRPFCTSDPIHLFDPTPADKQPNAQPDSKLTPANTETFSTAHRVLLVEDNPINQEVAIMILEELGLDVVVANNGVEAIACLKQSCDAASPFDLVLMDCQMPEMDGYATTAAIRAGRASARYEKVPVIAMTANAMQGDKQKCLNAGMDDYLAKPIEPDALFKTLARWLADAPATGPISESVSPPAVAGTHHTVAPAVRTPDASLQQEGVTASQQQSTTPTGALWNETEALDSLIGKTELLLKLLAQFNKTLPRRLDVLETAVKSADFTQIEQSAHSLKGSAGQLRSPIVVAQAQAIEQLATEHKLDQITALAPQFIAQCHALNMRFQQYIEDHTNSD